MKHSEPPSLHSPVSVLHGVGHRIEEKLHRLGIQVIGDLLFHLPLRYEDRTRLCPIGALQAGKSNLIEGIIDITQVKYGKRRSLLCQISDGTGAIILRFFHFSRSQQNRLQRGSKIRCYGQPRPGTKTLEMIHPEYKLLSSDNEVPVEDTLTPVYPATDGLQQPTLRKLTTLALTSLTNTHHKFNELLPESILNKLQLPKLAEALQYVHRPPPDAITQQLLDGVHPAQRRLAFEEILAQYLSLQQLRKQVRSLNATSLQHDGMLVSKFLDTLSFKLTSAQKKAVDEITSELQTPKPMLRLLQGDVGSGKTVVAAIIALQTCDSGYQAAIMAPTELLAEQHFNTFKNWFESLPVDVIKLTGKSGKTERREILEKLAADKPCIAIGTHALFQEDVIFSRLRLIVIDEQHRFGVHQRLSLLNKGKSGNMTSHQLVMTATPIPRTLAMTVYADLDISLIDELPPGRQPINTVVISTEKRNDVIERIRNACLEGRQVYWVCTLIEESEVLQCEAAINCSQYLKDRLNGITVGLIHGRLKSQEKDSIMSAFKSGDIQLLVATTVIEVGVDVPNASLMIIENAERLGLFQLHQLRGRIGRGNIKSDCVLLYQPPLSELAKIRLDTMRNTNNGFEIAQKDLELRGPGEMLGTRQTGLPELKIADLIRDVDLLPEVHETAKIIMSDYPSLIQPLIHRWLGNQVDYVKV